MPPFVTYALLGLCAVIFVLAIAVERRPEGDRRFGRVRRYAWIVQVGAFVAAYLVLRPGAAGGDPRDALKTASGARAPVFLDMYSNY